MYVNALDSGSQGPWAVPHNGKISVKSHHAWGRANWQPTYIPVIMTSMWLAAARALRVGSDSTLSGHCAQHSTAQHDKAAHSTHNMRPRIRSRAGDRTLPTAGRHGAFYGLQLALLKMHHATEGHSKRPRLRLKFYAIKLVRNHLPEPRYPPGRQQRPQTPFLCPPLPY
jgi:hypothetical protein